MRRGILILVLVVIAIPAIRERRNSPDVLNNPSRLND